MRFLKTVVGSFPPKNLPLDSAIRWIVDVQLKHDVDLISDGEQRTDMMSYFSSFPGLGVKIARPYVKSKILPLEEPKSFVKLRDLHFVRDYLRSIGRGDVKVKVSVTGPITLGFFCACNGLEYYGSVRDMRLYSDFSQALNPLIIEIAETGCYLQIDEPGLSAKVMNAKDAVKIVNQAISDVPAAVRKEGKLSAHVCGAITGPLFSDLMDLDVPILSLAFGAPNVRENLGVVSKAVLRSRGKKLGVGCVSVQAARKEDVEKLDVVVERLRRVEGKIGTEAIAYVHPDCGLRPTSEDAVEPILEILASSAYYLEKNE